MLISSYTPVTYYKGRSKALTAIQLCTHPVAIAFGRGNVVLDAARHWCPYSVHKAHDMVTQMAAAVVDGSRLLLRGCEYDTKLSHTDHILETRLEDRDGLAVHALHQLPAGKHGDAVQSHARA